VNTSATTTASNGYLQAKNQHYDASNCPRNTTIAAEYAAAIAKISLYDNLENQFERAMNTTLNALITNQCEDIISVRIGIRGNVAPNSAMRKRVSNSISSMT
jgi:hypothetical protein